MGTELSICKNCQDGYHRICIHNTNNDQILDFICLCDNPLHLEMVCTN